MKKIIFLIMASLPLAAPAQLVTGLEGASGSGIGPDRAIYVTEGAVGRISRIDTKSGEMTTYAEGLPPQVIPAGGAVDIAFRGGTAYVLVSLVGEFGGGTDGIYRVDGPNSFTIIADIGSFAQANPPNGFPFALMNGVQYAMEPYRDGFLVTDGHHNRVLRVRLNGEISEFFAFGEDTVPTGLVAKGRTVYVAEAGPLPHNAEDGKVVALWHKSRSSRVVASGAPLLVDVEFGRGRTLLALSNGVWSGPPGWDGDPNAAGFPADPNTGALYKVKKNGQFEELIAELNQPSSLEIIKNTAYIVTLAGDVWKFDNILPKRRHH